MFQLVGSEGIIIVGAAAGYAGATALRRVLDAQLCGIWRARSPTLLSLVASLLVSMALRKRRCTTFDVDSRPRLARILYSPKVAQC